MALSAQVAYSCRTRIPGPHRHRERNMLLQTRESCGIDQMIRINGKRLLADLRELASFGAFKTGVDRIALSAEDIAARRWLVGKLAAAGLNASMDRVGNVVGRDPNAT